MNLKNVGKLLIISSPLVFIADFFTLANLNFTQNKTLNNLGLFIGIISLALFFLGVVIYVVAKTKGKVISSKPKKQECPRWYRLAKLSIGLFIILGLYLVFPLYVGFVFLNRPGSGVENGSLITKIFFGYFVTLTQYALPLPFGIFVWPITVIGLGFVLFRKKYWRVIDILAVIFLIFIILLGFKTILNTHYQS